MVGVIASPLLFWIVIGSGFGTSFRSSGAGGQHYLDYFFPGALIMIVLFTAIFTMMSVIEDRKEGFLLSVLVAPVSRSVIVLGKVLGGATLATLAGTDLSGLRACAGHSLHAGEFRADRAGDLPGRVFADRAGLHHRLADGFDRRLSRHHQPVPDSAVAALGIAVSAVRRVLLDSRADAHQSADLRDRSAALLLYPGARHQPARSATNLRGAGMDSPW